MTTYSQRDSRWANKVLGKSGLKFKDYGCAVTAAANVVSEFLRLDITPGSLCDWLNANGGFTADGLLYWDAVSRFTNRRLVYVGTNRLSVISHPFNTHYALRNVLLGLNVGSQTEHWASHFVRELPWGKVFDPWTGRIQKFPSLTLKDKKSGANRRFFRAV